MSTARGDIRPQSVTPRLSAPLIALHGHNGSPYFAGFDPRHGIELWRSDGTSGGTTLVKDIRSGIEGSSPYGFTSMGGVVYFVADDGIHGEEIWKTDGTEAAGFELWKSDGTAAGTVMIKDIHSGPSSSNPSGLTNAGAFSTSVLTTVLPAMPSGKATVRKPGL